MKTDTSGINPIKLIPIPNYFEEKKDINPQSFRELLE